jgi:glycosyltransferase involved in cell wall biosynthesis
MTITNPKVSILIPVFNVEPYLRLCLNSVVNQSLKDIQIICVNDGSTDSSLEILKEFAAKDGRIILVDKQNEGYGKAMNVATDYATGEYIGIVEPDDYVSYEMFETLYNVAHNNNLDFVKSDFYRFAQDADGDVLYKLYRLSDDKNRYNKVFCPIEETDSLKFIMNTWCGIYKRLFIEDNSIVYNETPGASFQDNGFYFQTFAFAKRAMILDIPLYNNRRGNPNSSVNNSKKVYAMKAEYDYIREKLSKYPETWEKLKGWYWVRKYDNYEITINRISDEFKRDFCYLFATEFKTAIENKEIDMNLFCKFHQSRIKLMLKNPELFYKTRCEVDEETNQPSYNQKLDVNELRYKLAEMQNSTSWKVGRLITWLPRKIKSRMR